MINFLSKKASLKITPNYGYSKVLKSECTKAQKLQDEKKHETCEFIQFTQRISESICTLHYRL